MSKKKQIGPLKFILHSQFESVAWNQQASKSISSFHFLLNYHCSLLWISHIDRIDRKTTKISQLPGRPSQRHFLWQQRKTAAIYGTILCCLYKTYMFKTRKEHITFKILPDPPAFPPSKPSLNASIMQPSLSHPLLSSHLSKFSANQTEISLHHYHSNTTKTSDLAISFELGSPVVKPTHRKIDADNFVLWGGELGKEGVRVKELLLTRKAKGKRGILGSSDFEKISLRSALQGKRHQLGMEGKTIIKIMKAGEAAQHRKTAC